MRVALMLAAVLALGLAVGFSRAVAGDDDDAAAAPAQNGPPSLNAEQQRAVGIVVAHPVPASAPERVAALGEVLDPTVLISDQGDSQAAAAAERTASTEASRLRALYQGAAGASLKMLEAAEAEQIKAHALAETASARFALHWGPLAALPASERQKLIDRAGAGRALLLRADLPGRHSIGAVPETALLSVDGLLVPGRVLGTLQQSGELQSVGLLIEVPHPPPGLGVGARVAVTLMGPGQKGVALPKDALLYDESGAYVFKQLAPGSGAKIARFAAVKVKLLSRHGEGWLVSGVDDDDNIVVRGAGVLWSLQGMGSHPVDDDDD
jgi:hypothetical protein